MLFFMDKNNNEDYSSEVRDVFFYMWEDALKCSYEMLKKHNIYKKEEYRSYMKQVRESVGNYISMMKSFEKHDDDDENAKKDKKSQDSKEEVKKSNKNMDNGKLSFVLLFTYF